MNPKLKSVLKFITPRFVLNYRIRQFENNLILEWQKRGSPLPPPHLVKRRTIKKYQKKYRYETFVETGTYLGQMVEAQKKRFKKIISIELGEELYKNASEKFKNDNHIKIYLGDSSRVLQKIISELDNPAIFWLDGHYSGGITAKGDLMCPILSELDAILSTNNFKHILLIDDARLFTGRNDYPTIEELIDHIKHKNTLYEVEIQHDIIRCVIN